MPKEKPSLIVKNKNASRNYKLDESLLFKGWMDYDYYTEKFKEWDGKPEGYNNNIIEVKVEK